MRAFKDLSAGTVADNLVIGTFRLDSFRISTQLYLMKGMYLRRVTMSSNAVKPVDYTAVKNHILEYLIQKYPDNYIGPSFEILYETCTDFGLSRDCFKTILEELVRCRYIDVFDDGMLEPEYFATTLQKHYDPERMYSEVFSVPATFKQRYWFLDDYWLCFEKDGPDCIGTAKYRDGTEQGEWKDGQLDGVGKRRVDWSLYEGEFRNGLLNGKGRESIISNTERTIVRYVGDYSDGLRHGHGRLLLDGGVVYEGEFSEGEICGKAKWHYPDGSVLETDKPPVTPIIYILDAGRHMRYHEDALNEFISQSIGESIDDNKFSRTVLAYDGQFHTLKTFEESSVKGYRVSDSETDIRTIRPALERYLAEICQNFKNRGRAVLKPVVRLFIDRFDLARRPVSGNCDWIGLDAELVVYPLDSSGTSGSEKVFASTYRHFTGCLLGRMERHTLPNYYIKDEWAIYGYLSSIDSAASLDDVVEFCEAHNIESAESHLFRLMIRGQVYAPKTGQYRVV